MTCKIFAAAVCLISINCVGDLDGLEEVGALEAGLVSANKLSANKLSANKLSANKLSANKLSANRLADDTLNFNSVAGDGIEATSDGREVLEYLAKCALPEGEVLTVVYDSVTYHYPGLLDLAPAWVDQPLTDSEKRMVSACLYTHVNAYGASVDISVRSVGAIWVDANEAIDFSVYEGTFFGLAFLDSSESIKWYACQGEEAAVALAQSSDRSLRVCTDATPDCEIEALGRCQDICDTHTPGEGWSDCWAYGVNYAETISAFLRAD